VLRAVVFTGSPPTSLLCISIHSQLIDLFQKDNAMNIRRIGLCLVGLALMVLQTSVVQADLLTGLTAHWPLNETVGETSAVDLVSGNNAALLGAGAQFVADGTRGQVLAVNGTPTGAAVAPSNPVSLDAGTILGWVLLDPSVNSGAHHFFPGQSMPGGNRIYFYSQVRDLKIGMGNSGAIGTTTAPSFDSDWHQVALTWSANSPGSGSGNFSVYYDGSEVASNAYTGLNTPATWFSIGGNYDPTDPAPHTSSLWNGRISDVGVWNRSLSGSEISEIFMAGSIPVPEPSSIVIACGSLIVLAWRTRKAFAVR
jgi:hypothetical protein